MSIPGFDAQQSTLAAEINCAGIGLHNGRPVAMTIRPAAVDSGIRFIRSDLATPGVLPAADHLVSDTFHATTLGDQDLKVSTTEHLMAALAGFGIDNADVVLDADEVPIMDGSASPFLELMEQAGRRPQKAARKFFRIKRELAYRDGEKEIIIRPLNGLKITITIDFEHHYMQSQVRTLLFSEQAFRKEIAPARTFGFIEDIDKLWALDLARGGSLENAVVIGEKGVLNETGLRFDDEFVRHKILDLIGDFALLGWPVLGHIIAYKSGHSQHRGLMQVIRANPDAWDYVSFPVVPDTAAEPATSNSMHQKNRASVAGKLGAIIAPVPANLPALA